MRRSNTRDLGALKEIGLDIAKERNEYGQEYLAIRIPKDDVVKTSSRTPYIRVNNTDLSLYNITKKNGDTLYFEEVLQGNNVDVVIKQGENEIGRIPKSIIQGLDDDGKTITIRILEGWRRGKRRERL